MVRLVRVGGRRVCAVYGVEIPPQAMGPPEMGHPEICG